MVSDVKVSQGQNISKGQPLLVLEAMKMENVLLSHIDGVIEEIHVKTGDNVSAEQLLISIKACD